MSSDDSHFEGWIGEDKHCLGKLEWKKFTPKKWTEDDVEFKIECCGICGSDIHTLRSGWGPTKYPICVGHEIVGKVTRVGKNVKSIKIGDRVGVGAQGDSCRECPECKNGFENFCHKGQIGTYNGVYRDDHPSGPGQGQSQGGYATYGRYNSHFVIPIPDKLESPIASVLLCGGVTVYSPLVDNGAGKEGNKRIGISGIGGLGHMGLLLAKALGAEQLTAISHTHSKEKLAKELGANDFLAITDDKATWAKHAKSLDILVITNNNSDMDVNKYISLVRRGGNIVFVGVPEGQIPMPLFSLLFSGVKISGSPIGSPQRIVELLDLAASKNIKPLIETRPMKDANQAVLDTDAGKPRFRYVLVNDTSASL